MRTVALGDVCEVNVGRTPARADAMLWGRGEPWLSISDMNQGALITTTREQITPAGARRGRQVQPGTVLLSFKLSIGKVAIAGMPLYTNEAIAALPIKDPNRLDERYLLHALGALDLAAGSNRAAMGATLNKAKLVSVGIPLPPLPEQRRIAAILDAADAIRTKRRQALAHLDTLAQSVFHAMFGGEELPKRVFASLCTDMRNGLSPSKRGEVQATVLTLSAVTQGAFNPDAMKLGTFNAVPPETSRVDARDFLMCRGNGNRALVGVGVAPRADYRDLVFPDTVIAARVDRSRIDLGYLEFAWRIPSVRKQVEASSRTTNGTHKVNQQSLGSVVVPVPSIARQHEFATRVERINAHRTTLQRALATDEELFASLQSRAFKGEL